MKKIIIVLLIGFVNNAISNDWKWQKQCEGKPAKCEVWFNLLDTVTDISAKESNTNLNISYKTYKAEHSPSATFIILQNSGLTNSQNNIIKNALSQFVTKSQNTQKIGIIQSEQNMTSIATLGSQHSEIRNKIGSIKISQSKDKAISTLKAAIDYLGGNDSPRKLAIWITTDINVNNDEVREIEEKLNKDNANIRLIAIHLKLSELSANSSGNLVTLTNNSGGKFLSLSENQWLKNIVKLASYSINGGFLDVDTTSICGSKNINFNGILNNGTTESTWQTNYPTCQIITPTNNASIAIVSTSSIQGDGNVGDTIKYTYTITNTGNQKLKDIKITEQLEGVEFTSETIASLDVGVIDNYSITGTYTVTQADVIAGQITNQATIVAKPLSGAEISDLSDNNSPLEDNPTVTILTPDTTPGIAIITKAQFESTQEVGKIVNYTYTITNTGKVDLTDITVTNSLVGLELSGSPLSNLAVGASESTKVTAIYKIKQSDIDSLQISNQATVTSKSPTGEDVTDISDDNSLTEDDTTVLVFDKPPSFWKKYSVALISLAVFLLLLLFLFLLRKKPKTSNKRPYAALIEYQGGKEVRHVLRDDTVVLGRNRDCTIIFGDSSISGKHAVIKRMNSNKITIIDTISSNGILVNDKKTNESDLNSGDTIQIGETKLRFERMG